MAKAKGLSSDEFEKFNWDMHDEYKEEDAELLEGHSLMSSFMSNV